LDREQLIIRFALAVLGIWCLVVLVSLVLKDYTVLTAITPVMLIVTGFLFGFRGDGKGKNGAH
jgi:hypothetical protein